MSKITTSSMTRRAIILGASAVAAFPAPALLAQSEPPPVTRDQSQAVTRNVSGFYTHKWQDHFDQIGRGIIISDTNTRVLQHWTQDAEMRLYPTSVPLTDDLTRRGYTEVVEMRKNPGWAPTPSMRASDPDWPAYVKGGDPSNPLGTRALYLSWQYYRIHGTHDTRKIGRRSSNGCIGLYNQHIEELFARTALGTQVKLI